MNSLLRSTFFRISNCTGHDEKHEEKDPKKQRYTGIPAIPMDIGYKSGKETGGSHEAGYTRGMMSNPVVPIGMALTCAALFGMFRNSMTGNKMGTQKYMRYRIYAQFGTVLALVAGFALAGSQFYEKKGEDKKVF
uniref:HIG1 domain-containing protein n=1 Tax=Parastrongyloides trichosuri TaxID=131310 RepID=A0A0N5A4H5_PARTI